MKSLILVLMMVLILGAMGCTDRTDNGESPLSTDANEK